VNRSLPGLRDLNSGKRDCRCRHYT